ncbi:MAG: hypothetical protein ACQGVK_05540 [Myxococcota bacterium]
MLAVVSGTLLVVVGGFFAFDDFDLIRPSDEAHWITRPIEPKLGIFRVETAAPTPTIFSTRFILGALPESAPLHLKALRRATVHVNGQAIELPGEDGRPGEGRHSWKRERVVDLAAALELGPNDLRIAVTNPRGPAVLHAWIDGLGRKVATGPRWRAQWRKGVRRAVVADDMRPYRHAASLPTTLDGLARYGWVVVLCFLLGATPGALGVAAPAWLGGRHWPRTALVGLGLFWLVFFAARVIHLPAGVGFDSEGHHAYLDFLAAQGRLPTATDGWSMFHPPVYHVVTALIRGLLGTEAGSLADRVVVHALPALSGFATAWIAGRTAALLAPERPGLRAVAIVAAGLMPMNLYMSAFVSNESVHAAVVAGALWWTCEILAARRVGAGSLVGLSLLLGLALLVKSTSLPIVPAIVALVGFKLVWLEGRSLPSSLGAAAAMLAGVVLVAGWFYWRNWSLYGTPVVTNYDVPTGTTYWIPPGFHMPGWYLAFGESLIRPYYASFHSFLDGLYSTFWGDGQGSGRMGIDPATAPWNPTAMATVYPLGLVGSLLLFAGFGIQGRRAFAGADLGRRLGHTLLLGISYGMALMLLLITFRYPHGPLPKAFYIQPVVMPVAVAFAFGAVALDDGLRHLAPRAARAVYHGACAALTGAIGLAFLA